MRSFSSSKLETTPLSRRYQCRLAIVVNRAIFKLHGLVSGSLPFVVVSEKRVNLAIGFRECRNWVPGLGGYHGVSVQ